MIATDIYSLQPGDHVLLQDNDQEIHEMVVDNINEDLLEVEFKTPFHFKWKPNADEIIMVLDI